MPPKMIKVLVCHIPGMSTMIASLRDLLKTEVHFQWNSQHDAALSKINHVLSTAHQYSVVLILIKPAQYKPMPTTMG